MSDRSVRPQVDALGDIAWARLERGLWARLDRGEVAAHGEAVAAGRRRRIAAVIAAAAAVVVVVVVAIVIAAIVAGGSDARPTVATVAPPATATTATTAERTRVVSGDAPSTAAFGDVGVDLAAHSAVEYATGMAHVERGQVWFTVAPRGARPAFVVYAGDAVIEVIGTRFRVTRELETIGVEVDHGVVRVQFRGDTATLHAGERWTSDRAGSAADPAPPAPPTPAPPPSTPAPPPSTPPPAVPKPAPAAAVADRARYEQLAAIESRDPAAAIAGYLELAKHGTAWAELAAFAAARLAVDHRDPRAAGLLAGYLRRFPAGANANDARQLLAHVKGP